MTNLLAEALAVQGFYWLLFGAFLAGLVRGFTGFGTAMVFLPITGGILSPVWAIITLISMDLIGPLHLLPQAIRKGHPRDILLMGIGMLITLPVGLYLLARMNSDTYRYIVSFATLLGVFLIASGVRYRGVMTKPFIAATGALGGFLGGVAGVPGPPVMVLYMASTLPVATIRANLILFLFMADVLMFPVLFFQGTFSWMPVFYGLLALLPYIFGAALGTFFFNPEKEAVYRIAAFCVISASAVFGLPLWNL